MDDAALLTLAELALGDYAAIRNAYKMEIAGWIMDYLLTDKARITKYRNQFKIAITNNFPDAFYQGFMDGGGGGRSDVPRDADEWLTAKINGEYGFVDWLFLQLKEFKRDPETAISDYQAEADRRAEGYAKTLDGVYAEGKVWGGKDVMLTFGGNDGFESCEDCQRLKGQRHKASWWIQRGLVPGQQGNRNFACGGWNCQHILFDDLGNVWTV